MEPFNKTHVIRVEERLRQSGLRSEAMLNDLLDHYCCIIEAEMEKGIGFEMAYKKAWNTISPNGLIEIEEELFFMLNFNKQTTMKKIVYACGFCAATFISAGLLFRIFHWEGTPTVGILGFAFLIITCLLVLISSTKKIGQLSLQGMVRLLSGNTAAILIAVGSIFKTLSFPHANLITLIGFLFLIILYIPTFFYHLYQQSLSEA